MRAPARRMHFLERHHVARAHGAVLVLAALADPHAASRRLGEAEIVLGEREVRVGFLRPVAGPEAQILVDAVRADHLARVHLPVGIPDRLELVERVDEVLAVHERQKLRLALPVTVLAGQRSAVRDHQVRRLRHEPAVLVDALSRLEVELDARVHASLTEMPIERALVTEIVEQLAELAQVFSQLVRRHRSVLPPFPRLGAVREASRRAQTGLAHLPQLFFLVLVIEQLHRGAAGEPRHQRFRLRVRLRLRVAAELDEQPPLSLRQELRVLRMDVHPLHVLDEHVVEPLAADGLRFHHLGDVIARVIDVLVSEHQERSARRARHEADRRLQHHRAGSLGSHQRARHVEALLGQELRQVETRDAPWNVREPRADLLRVAVAQLAKPPVDLAAPATRGDDPLQLLFGRRADGEPRSVVEDDFQLLDVVGGAAPHDGVNAARVVADHPAERAVVVRRRIGREGQVLLLGFLPQRVQHQPWLHARAAAGVIDVDDPVQVFRAVDDERDVAALAGQAGAAAAHRDRCAEFARGGDRLDHILCSAGHDHADRNLAVVGPVRRVERAAAAVETHFAADSPAQLLFQSTRVQLLSFGRLARPPAYLGLHSHAKLF